MDSDPKNFFVTHRNIGGSQHRGGVAYRIGSSQGSSEGGRFRDRESAAATRFQSCAGP